MKRWKMEIGEGGGGVAEAERGPTVFIKSERLEFPLWLWFQQDLACSYFSTEMYPCSLYTPLETVKCAGVRPEWFVKFVFALYSKSLSTIINPLKWFWGKRVGVTACGHKNFLNMDLLHFLVGILQSPLGCHLWLYVKPFPYTNSKHLYLHQIKVRNNIWNR